MFLNELFNEDENPFTQDEVTYLDDLSHIPFKFHSTIKRLAKFHHVAVDYDEKSKRWFATSTAGLHPFIEDAKYMVSAAHYGHGNNMTEDMGGHGQLVAMFFTPDKRHKIHVFRQGPNVFEIEDDTTNKTVIVHCGLDQIRRMLPKKGFPNMFKVSDDDGAERDLDEAKPQKTGTMPSEADYEQPKKFNKGMDKVYARVMQRQMARELRKPMPSDRDDEQVAVVVDDHPDKLAYGHFRRVGRNGLFHIVLNGGALPGWASGDEIAVRPHEVFAVWDPVLKDKVAVHKQYK